MSTLEYPGTEPMTKKKTYSLRNPKVIGTTTIRVNCKYPTIANMIMALRLMNMNFNTRMTLKQMKMTSKQAMMKLMNTTKTLILQPSTLTPKISCWQRMTLTSGPPTMIPSRMTNYKTTSTTMSKCRGKVRPKVCPGQKLR